MNPDTQKIISAPSLKVLIVSKPMPPNFWAKAFLIKKKKKKNVDSLQNKDRQTGKTLDSFLVGYYIGNPCPSNNNILALLQAPF